MSKRKLIPGVVIRTCPDCDNVLRPGEEFCSNHNEEQKAKISAAKKGKKHSAEHRANMSNALKGRKLSAEHKAKIGRANKGKKRAPRGPLSAEHRAKIGKAHKGRKLSDGHRAKISAANKGKKRLLSDEVRIKLILARSGPNNHNWVGGVNAAGYCTDFANDPDRYQIYKRDGYRCQLCGCTVTGERGKTLWHRHHIDENKLNNNPLNLITLCNNCNINILPHLPEEEQAKWRLKFMRHTRSRENN